MFNTITWQGYWVTLALLSASYYLVIYLLYWRNDFKIEFPKRGAARKYPSASPAVTNFIKEESLLSSTNQEHLNEIETPLEIDEHLAYACMDELHAYFQSSKRTKIVKEEFLFAVQTILSKYPSLKSSEFKEAVSNLIVSEAAHNCSIHLSGEDMDHVWLEQ